MFFSDAIITRANAWEFSGISDRKKAAGDYDLLISVKIGDAGNKKSLRIYVPNDARAGNSAALGCLIANELSGSYDLFYPAEVDGNGKYEILGAGKKMAIYLEIGSADYQQNPGLIGQAIYSGIKKYFGETS
jgi:hypothetical protein